MSKDFKVPSDFLWGASTASHQVEGNNHNQWTQWEQSVAKKEAASTSQDIKSLANYQQIAARVKDPENYISGRGVAHYDLYRADFDLLEKLNMNAYRFSIEWSRLEPSEGYWNQTEIDYYKQYISDLKQRSIEPILTIWHWTMPIWLADKGGFEKRANIKYFERYCAKIAEEFGPQLKYVIVLNEPNVYSSHSYFLALWPPGVKNFTLSWIVYYNLTLAYKAAYKVLKSSNLDLMIGIADQLTDSRPINNNPFSKLVVKARNYIWNWWFLNRINKQMDFIGLNYYFTDYYDWRQRKINPPKPLNDMGWYMEPGSIYNLLMEIDRRYKQPIIITENGLADETDTYRQWWITETLKAIEKAMDHNVKLKGYLHWSLLDNFEWASGWWPKFGLVSVDRKTMKRTIRPSALWFAEQIKKSR